LEAEFPNSTSTRKAKEYLGSSSGSLAKNAKNDAPSMQKSGSIPAEYAMSANYPNPFNPSTSIEYALPKMSSIKAVIYNTLGQKVKSFSAVNKHAGRYYLTWDGRNDAGLEVPSSLYILDFYAESMEPEKSVYTKSIKMLLLR
jgi:hypothetical protein